MTEPRNLDEEVEKARKVAEELNRVTKFAQEKLGEVEALEPTPGKRFHETLRCYVAPDYPNARFLAKAGKPVKGKGGEDIERLLRREGDVFVIFRGGYCISEDKVVLEWFEKHTDLCRDVEDVATKAWVLLRQAMQHTSVQEPSLPQGMNPEEITPGMVMDLASGARVELVESGLSALKGAAEA